MLRYLLSNRRVFCVRTVVGREKVFFEEGGNESPWENTARHPRGFKGEPQNGGRGGGGADSL